MSELAKALIRFHKATAGFEADKKGNRSNYASIGAVINNVKEASKYGLTFTQPVDFDERHIFVRTIVMHESGEKIESRYPVIVDDFTNNQKVGGAITYAKRYALASIFGTEKGVEDQDDDGEINGLYLDEIKPEVTKITDTSSGEGGSENVSSLNPEPSDPFKPKMKKVTEPDVREMAVNNLKFLVKTSKSAQDAVEQIKRTVSEVKDPDVVKMMYQALQPKSEAVVNIFIKRQEELENE